MGATAADMSWADTAAADTIPPVSTLGRLDAAVSVTREDGGLRHPIGYDRRVTEERWRVAEKMIRVI